MLSDSSTPQARLGLIFTPHKTVNSIGSDRARSARWGPDRSNQSSWQPEKLETLIKARGKSSLISHRVPERLGNLLGRPLSADRGIGQCLLPRRFNLWAGPSAESSPDYLDVFGSGQLFTRPSFPRNRPKTKPASQTGHMGAGRSAIEAFRDLVEFRNPISCLLKGRNA
jgi:hypothetical protein